MTQFEELLGGRSPTISNILSVFCEQKTDEDIREVMEYYEIWFTLRADISVPEGEEVAVARKNIGSMLIFINPTSERKRIYGALNNISHPVFGSGFWRD